MRRFMVKYWEQPTLTENGTMGGSTFAVAASSERYTDSGYAYNAFNGNLWRGQNSMPAWISWYFPEPMILESILIQNKNIGKSGTESNSIKNYCLQCSLELET